MSNRTSDMLADRSVRYGNFTTNAKVIMSLKRVIAPYEPKLADDQIEALHMICNKIGRILNGDHNYADSWADIAGYATLVAERLEQKDA